MALDSRYALAHANGVNAVKKIVLIFIVGVLGFLCGCTGIDSSPSDCIPKLKLDTSYLPVRSDANLSAIDEIEQLVSEENLRKRAELLQKRIDELYEDFKKIAPESPNLTTDEIFASVTSLALEISDLRKYLDYIYVTFGYEGARLFELRRAAEDAIKGIDKYYDKNPSCVTYSELESEYLTRLTMYLSKALTSTGTGSLLHSSSVL